MKKQLTLKILITIVLLIIATVVLVVTNKINKDKSTAKVEGTITIELVNIDGIKESKDIDFKKGDTVWSLIKDNYEVRYDNSTYGIVLYDINDIKTDFTNEYIAIYVDDKYSNVGISYIEIKDGLVVSLRETKI